MYPQSDKNKLIQAYLWGVVVWKRGDDVWINKYSRFAYYSMKSMLIDLFPIHIAETSDRDHVYIGGNYNSVPYCSWPGAVVKMSCAVFVVYRA